MPKSLPAHTPLDDPALHALIEAQREPLSRFVRARVSRPEEAEDLLQEVWYQLSRTWLTQPLDDARAWLYRVARNQLIDHYRKRSALWLEEYLTQWDEDGAYALDWLQADATDPELALWQSQFWEAFYQALDSLPEAQREVFLRHELEGLTLREIAEQSGTPLKTIISRKGYAVRRLRILLEDFWEEMTEEWEEY